MVGIREYTSIQIAHASQWAGEMRQEVSTKAHAAQLYVGSTVQSLRQNGLASVEKTKIFVLKHKEDIFFIGCCAATAYFSPALFFPVAIATIILRVELSRHLKGAAEEYLKDDHNPYKVNPQYGPHYVSNLDITLGAIAAIDAVALGTIFIAGSWTVALIPALGGIAAGSVAAKFGMDAAHSL